MSWIDDDFVPDPKRTTRHRGVVFNPWVNISTCILLTIVAGAATVWMTGIFVELSEKPDYPDQGLDIIGALIGLLAAAATTLCMVIATIVTIRWWIRNAKEHKEQQAQSPNQPGWQGPQDGLHPRQGR